MLKVHPQSAPQLKPAVPLPFAIRLLIVKVWPELTPGPQPGFVDALFAVMVAVPVPALSIAIGGSVDRPGKQAAPVGDDSLQLLRSELLDTLKFSLRSHRHAVPPSEFACLLYTPNGLPNQSQATHHRQRERFGTFITSLRTIKNLCIMAETGLKHR